MQSRGFTKAFPCPEPKYSCRWEQGQSKAQVRLFFPSHTHYYDTDIQHPLPRATFKAMIFYLLFEESLRKTAADSEQPQNIP